MQYGVNSSFTMSEQEVITYVKNRQDCFGADAELVCQEIGDGNLNYVFRVRDLRSGHSVIVKQAGPVARISDEFVVSTDRNRLEYQLLSEYNKIVPEFVPDVYGFDQSQNCMIMEDLSAYIILRQGLIAGQFYEHFPKDIANFMAKSHVGNLDWVLGGKAKKIKMSQFINPDLCEITEDLVLTEPFIDCPRNEMSEATRAYVKEQLWSDPALLHQVNRLKWQFMTDTETLIHGDLHTGSVFVTEHQTKVIDHEFACFGPAGFDLGSFLANILFAMLHHEVKMTEGTRSYFENVMECLISSYRTSFTETWRLNHLKDELLLTEKLNKVMEDAAGYCGCELIRRTVGIAKVVDISILEEPEKYIAESRAIAIGKRLIMEANHCKSARDFLDRI